MARVNSDKPTAAQRQPPLAGLPPRPEAMLRLPEVTLLCVQPRAPALGLATMQHCMRRIRFGEALLFTDLQRLPQAPPGIQVKGLRIDSPKDYADFMLRGLSHYVHTSHVLVVQWNGFVLDPAQWDPTFQLYDYIGGPLPAGSANRRVGRGSFSLRSRRLLLALQHPAMQIRAPEDHCIRHDNRERLEQLFDVRFAPADVARRFAFSSPAHQGPTFGFQGLDNLPRVMSAQALGRLVRSLPDELLNGQLGYGLCAGLIDHGATELAKSIISRRQAGDPTGWRTMHLRLKLALARWR